MVQGTPARHLFKCAGDSNLDSSQAEGPNRLSTTQAESHSWVHTTGSVRLEGSRWKADLLTKTLGGHSCTF